MFVNVSDTMAATGEAEYVAMTVVSLATKEATEHIETLSCL